MNSTRHQPSPVIEQRLRQLRAHLEQENPTLIEVVDAFQAIDKVAYRIGLLHNEQSYATRIPWWPLISILGTFSAGKSTFINSFLEQKLQNTGNQAVDDKFTVICYSDDEQGRTLPGIALDADPRFPFFKISQDIEKVAHGEGRRIDAYLQLKTTHSQAVRGKILIDSPGFDADAQRTSTLRITDHIIDLSDLVLVLFDARHPEPGSMLDTLTHLVEKTINRHDSNKFLYILNQLDVTAREDNPEDVIAAWQRALAQKGLTAGRFYGIYNADAAIPIDDPSLKERYQTKRDHDLAEILERIDQVEVERAYRIVGALEKTAQSIEQRDLPRLKTMLNDWRRLVIRLDAASFGLILITTIASGIWLQQSQGIDLNTQLNHWLQSPSAIILTGLITLGIGLAIHQRLRLFAADRQLAKLRKQLNDSPLTESVSRAFRRSTRWWRPLWLKRPAGWNRQAQQQLKDILQQANGSIQKLNDRFTNPSGCQLKQAVPNPDPLPPEELQQVQGLSSHQSDIDIRPAPPPER